MSTLLLSRSHVARYVDSLVLLEELKVALRSGPSASGQRVSAPVSDGASVVAVFPGLANGLAAYSVRVGTKGTEGTLQLHEQGTGKLLAVMDAGFLLGISEAVLGALAADVLARKDASRVALIGAGVNAGALLKCLRLVRSLKTLRVFDAQLEKSVTLAHRLYTTLSLPSQASDSVEEAVGEADLVIVCTGSREPLLFPGMVLQGTHVTALGADAVGKRELSAGLINQSVFVCDDRALAESIGAIGNVGLTAEAIHADLGEVLTGKKPGRTSEDQVTVFAAVGSPFTDLIAAWHVYSAAREDSEIPRVDFSS